MNLEHLQSFLAVVDEGSFHRAADARRISQPALTKHIQALEAWVGAPVVERSHRGATLTPVGRELIGEARGMVERSAAFTQRARRLAHGETGTLAVGFGMSSLRQVPAAIRRFSARYPDVTIALEDIPSSEQARQVRERRLDLGFGRRPGDPDVAYRPLWHDQLAYATLDMSMVAEDVPRLLRDAPLVRLAREKGPGLAKQIDALELAWGFRFGFATVTHDLLTVIAMAAAGVGPALIPLSARSIAPETLNLVPLEHPEAAWSVGAIWSPRSANRAVRNLIRIASDADIAPMWRTDDAFG